MPQVERSFDNTIEFAAQASVVPLDRKPKDPKDYFPPKPPGRSEKLEVRDWQITGLYLGTDKTLKEIGQSDRFTVNLTRERVRQIFFKNLERLHEASDEEVKRQFPLESLETKKPLTLESRKRRSQAQGGLSVRAAKLVGQGKSAREIAKALRITSSRLGSLRKILLVWGQKVPYDIEASSPKYKQNLEKLKGGILPYEEAQAIIDTVTRRIYRSRSMGNNPDFCAITPLARKSGLIFKEVSTLAKILKQEQVPTGMVEEYTPKEKPGRKSYAIGINFIPSYAKERAQEVFKNHPELAPLRINPV